MLPYGFKISDITLAGLTHLTRHRMQSPVIPPIETVDLSRIVIPDSIAQNKDAWKVYQRGAAMAYEDSIELLQRERCDRHERKGAENIHPTPKLQPRSVGNPAGCHQYAVAAEETLSRDF